MQAVFSRAQDSGTRCLNGILFCAVLAVVSTQAIACDRVTEGKYFSCLSAQWLRDFTAFAVSEDMDGIRAYLAGDKCLLLRPNLPVTVTDDPELLGTTTAFMIQGIRFYAPSEEIVLK
jgi:hypothetical protein